MVRNAVRDAVGFDYFLNLAEFVCRHGGKQVVFDLACEPAGAVIDSRMVLDVSAGEDLFTQEIYGRAALQKRHALMIRGEYQSQIQAEEHLLCDEEQEGMPPTEKETEQAQKPNGVQNEKTHFNDGMRDLVAHQEFDAVDFQHKRLEHRQREETEVLVSHCEAREAALPGCLVLGKCEQRDIDVGVGGNVIRRAMMVVVLVQPPTVAESEQEIGMDESKNFIAGGAAENFLMAGVVNDEAKLSEDKCQESGVAEFGPRILKPVYEQERGDEEDDVEKYLSAVICGLLGQ